MCPELVSTIDRLRKNQRIGEGVVPHVLFDLAVQILTFLFLRLNILPFTKPNGIVILELITGSGLPENANAPL